MRLSLSDDIRILIIIDDDVSLIDAQQLVFKLLREALRERVLIAPMCQRRPRSTLMKMSLPLIQCHLLLVHLSLPSFLLEDMLYIFLCS